MKLKLTGDFKKLAVFQDRIRKAPQVLDTLSAVLAEETVELVREGIEESVDPYRKPFAPLKLRNGRILQDTGGLKASWHPRHTRDSFTVYSGKKTAKWHQGGTGIYGPKKRRIKPIRAKALKLGNSGLFARSVKGVPRRRMVPERGRLPAKWRKRYEEVGLEVLTHWFKTNR